MTLWGAIGFILGLITGYFLLLVLGYIGKRVLNYWRYGGKLHIWLRIKQTTYKVKWAFIDIYRKYMQEVRRNTRAENNFLAPRSAVSFRNCTVANEDAEEGISDSSSCSDVSASSSQSLSEDDEPASYDHGFFEGGILTDEEANMLVLSGSAPASASYTPEENRERQRERDLRNVEVTSTGDVNVRDYYMGSTGMPTRMTQEMIRNAVEHSIFREMVKAKAQAQKDKEMNEDAYVVPKGRKIMK